MPHALDDTDEHWHDCPECGSTDIHKDEELWRPWVIDATCRDCGHSWKLSNS